MTCPLAGLRLAAFGPAHVYLFMGPLGALSDFGVSAGTQHRNWEFRFAPMVSERYGPNAAARRSSKSAALVPAHGLCGGEPVHAGADGEAASRRSSSRLIQSRF